MFAMGIIGFFAGVLFKKGWLRRNRISLAVFGAFSAVIIYGGIMNPASAFMFSTESLSLKLITAYYISGFPMDLIHAFGTVIFIMLAAEPMLEKMERIKIKYGLIKDVYADLLSFFSLMMNERTADTIVATIAKHRNTYTTFNTAPV